MLRFVVNKNEIEQKISMASSVIGSKSLDPILQCLLFKPSNGTISINATDLQTSVIAKVAVGEYEGTDSFAVDADLIDEIIKNLGTEEIQFEYANNKLTIRSGTSKYEILTFSEIEKFPSIELGDSGVKFTIDTTILADMLEKVTYAASTETAMRQLNGVYWEIVGGYLRLVASDGYRLALSEQKVELENEFDFILSLKSIKELQKFLSSTSSPTVEIIYDHSRISICSEETVMIIRTVDETFPDYKRVLPKAFKTRTVIKTAEFENALKRVMVIAKRGNERVQLRIYEDTMEITSQSSDFGEALEKISIQKEGSDMIINFNPKFLAEAIRHVDEEEVEFNFVDNLSPLQINPVTMSGYMYIVLPMRA